MPRKSARQGGTPQQIAEDLWAFWRSQALVAGMELDIFSPIAAGKHTAEEIARAIGTSQRGTPPLLDSLVAMGYLKKTANRYSLSPVAASFLVRGKTTYLGDTYRPTQLVWDAWGHLTGCVKTGLPFEAEDSLDRARDFFPKLVEAIFPGSYAAAKTAVSALPAKTRRGIRRILDVAAGSGAWSLPFVQAIPEARVTVVDLEEVTPITRQFAQRFGVAGRYDYLEGDLHQIDFGRGAFDLVILGHIIHGLGKEDGQALVEKSAAALRKGGLLLIGEWIPNDSRTGPATAVLFGLNMLVMTDRGAVFTLREYRQWLKQSGFHKMKTIPLPGRSPIILAAK